MDSSATPLPLLPAGRYRRFLPIVGLLALLAAWILFFVGTDKARCARDSYGPAVEVVEAIACDQLAGDAMLPYLVAALFLDILALFALMAWVCSATEFNGLGAFAWFLAFCISLGWHGLLSLALCAL